MTKTFSIPMAAQQARALSIIVYGSLAAGYLADAAFPDLDGPLFAVTGALKLTGLIGSAALFLSSYGQQSQLGDCALDERERDERNRAYVATHRIMLGCLFGFFLYSVLAKAAGLWLPTGEGAFDLLSAFAIGSMSLPGAILAWRDRALPDEG
jgi:hypothetical protein